VSVDGLITVASDLSVRDTVDRLAVIVTSKGLTIFARIDHAANAKVLGWNFGRPSF
jgi:uncharacterized protein (DUF302 family)